MIEFKLRIVQSTDRAAELDTGTITAPSVSGVKVMVRRKKTVSSVIHFLFLFNLNLN